MELLVLVLCFLVELHYGKEIHPLVKEWLYHYAEGSGETRGLPHKYVQQTKEIVKKKLRENMETPRFPQCNTASVGSMQWYWDLSGVVAQFTFTTRPAIGGVLVSCQDTWNFNDLDTELRVPLGKVPGFIRKILASWVKVEGNSLVLSEKWLTRFNEGRAFKTEWHVYVSFNELGLPLEEAAAFNWDTYGLPVEWLKCKAAASQLEGAYVTELDEGWRVYYKNNKVTYQEAFAARG